MSGRVFDDRDTPDTERVTVVHRTTAERLWPGQVPTGKRVKFGRPDSNWPWIAIARFLRDLLFGVHPYDPWTLAAVASGVVVVALVAAWRPALCAASVDPIEALRVE